MLLSTALLVVNGRQELSGYKCPLETHSYESVPFGTQM